MFRYYMCSDLSCFEQAIKAFMLRASVLKCPTPLKDARLMPFNACQCVPHGIQEQAANCGLRHMLDKIDDAQFGDQVRFNSSGQVLSHARI